jgi:hypothetical protein
MLLIEFGDHHRPVLAFGSRAATAAPVVTFVHASIHVHGRALTFPPGTSA